MHGKCTIKCWKWSMGESEKNSERERERSRGRVGRIASLLCRNLSKHCLPCSAFYFNCNNCSWNKQKKKEKKNKNNYCPGEKLCKVGTREVGSWIFHTYIKQTKENARKSRKIIAKPSGQPRPNPARTGAAWSGEACKQTFQNSEFRIPFSLHAIVKWKVVRNI